MARARLSTRRVATRHAVSQYQAHDGPSPCAHPRRAPCVAFPLASARTRASSGPWPPSWASSASNPPRASSVSRANPVEAASAANAEASRNANEHSQKPDWPFFVDSRHEASFSSSRSPSAEHEPVCRQARQNLVAPLARRVSSSARRTARAHSRVRSTARASPRRSRASARVIHRCKSGNARSAHARRSNPSNASENFPASSDASADSKSASAKFGAVASASRSAPADSSSRPTRRKEAPRRNERIERVHAATRASGSFSFV